MNPIICVTEFSEHTATAMSAASAMARRWHERVLLVRSVDEREQFPRGTREHLVRDDHPRLAQKAAAFRAAGVDCEEKVLLGAPEESVAMFAQRVQARLVVLGCPPLSRLDTWVLGCTAEQVAQTTHVPLLLVRSESPFTEWVAGRKSLRVYAFVDPVDHSPAIAQALEEWRAIADEEVEFHDAPSDAARHPHDAANRCAQAAQTAGADLLVVSTHPRTALPLLPHPSLAGYLLREAPMSILIVPDTSVPHFHDSSSIGSAGT